MPDVADSDGISQMETYQKAGGGHILGICVPVPLGIG